MLLKRSFDSFLNDTVSLDDTRRNRIIRAHHSVRDRLKAIDEVRDRLSGTYLQGSYALQTVVRPLDREAAYDVDVVLAADFSDGHDNLVGGRQALRWLRDHIESIGLYEGKTTIKSHCVCIDYESDGQRFHLDVVPAHRPETTRGTIRIPPDWSESNPKGYIEWFEGQCREVERLRHTVRLLKFWRNLQACGPNSMVLTTLAAWHAPACARSLDDALIKTLHSLADWAREADMLSVEIPNPALPNEDLARNWRGGERIEFHNRLAVASETAEEALNCKDKEETVRLWNADELFAGEFPTHVEEPEVERAKQVSAAMMVGNAGVSGSGRVSTDPSPSDQKAPDSGGFYGPEK
jgi:hypothetical protein